MLFRRIENLYLKVMPLVELLEEVYYQAQRVVEMVPNGEIEKIMSSTEPLIDRNVIIRENINDSEKIEVVFNYHKESLKNYSLENTEIVIKLQESPELKEWKKVLDKIKCRNIFILEVTIQLTRSSKMFFRVVPEKRDPETGDSIYAEELKRNPNIKRLEENLFVIKF